MAMVAPSNAADPSIRSRRLIFHATSKSRGIARSFQILIPIESPVFIGNFQNNPATLRDVWDSPDPAEIGSRPCEKFQTQLKHAMILLCFAKKALIKNGEKKWPSGGGV